MSRSKPLGLNEWWVVRRAAGGFMYPSTMSTTRDSAKANHMAPFRDDVPKFHVWRNWREGRYGLAKHEVVRAEFVVKEDE